MPKSSPASSPESGFLESGIFLQVAAPGFRLLRCIALRKMEGHTTEEIAAQLGCGRTTVERRLRLIRLLWTEEERP